MNLFVLRYAARALLSAVCLEGAVILLLVAVTENTAATTTLALLSGAMFGASALWTMLTPR